MKKYREKYRHCYFCRLVVTRSQDTPAALHIFARESVPFSESDKNKKQLQGCYSLLIERNQFSDYQTLTPTPPARFGRVITS